MLLEGQALPDLVALDGHPLLARRLQVVVVPRAVLLVLERVGAAALERRVDVLAVVAEEEALVAVADVLLDDVHVAAALQLLVVLVADVRDAEDGLALAEQVRLLLLVGVAHGAAERVAVAVVDAARVPLAVEHGDAHAVVVGLRLHDVQAGGNVDVAGAVGRRDARLHLVVAVVAHGAGEAAVLRVDAEAPPLVARAVLVALALERALVVRARGVLVAVVEVALALVDVDAGPVGLDARAERLPARVAHGARGAGDAVAVVALVAGA